ncbi:hypothetical protein AO260_16325 [Pseudomonas sp. ABAC21]|nr:hypothetical protein AO260_16325 [Pseudomonas sp. ABAC21]
MERRGTLKRVKTATQNLRDRRTFYRFNTLRPIRITLRQRRAHHQLDLMKQHQRQDQHPHACPGEQHLRHRHAGGEALLRTAEQNGDAVFLSEAEHLAQQRRCHQHQRQQYAAGQHQPAQLPQRNLIPDPFVDRFAERAVDHQQDRTLVDELEPGFIAPDPVADPAAGNLPGNKWQQQLHADFQDRIHRGAALTVHVEQQRHQQRREENTEQAGSRRTADRRRDVAARQGGESNRRLHRGRQRTQVQHAHVQVFTDQRRQHWLERQAQQGKQHEGQAEHQQVQTPVTGTGDDGSARQLGAVQEKQQRNRQVGHPAKGHRRLAVDRQQGGKDHRGDQGQGEIVGEKTWTGHKQIFQGLPSAPWRL